MGSVLDAEIQTMMKSGVHYGHRTSRTHPKMKSLIMGVKNNIEIIDLEVTRTQLERAMQFLKSLPQEAQILFVGTLPAAQSVVRETATALGAPFVIERWLGGLITNFKMISGRIKHLLDLKKKRAAGEFEKYTKKEQQNIAEEIARSERVLGSLECLTHLPDALVVVGVPQHKTAIHEAQLRHIPVIAIVDTDADPTGIDFPIAANDNARSSVAFIVERLAEALRTRPHGEKGA